MDEYAIVKGHFYPSSELLLCLVEVKRPAVRGDVRQGARSRARRQLKGRLA
jgi:hypothetical protein